MKKKNTPILLLTGFLGSGKTTLVNRILGNKQGIKFAVLVNDIGEVNIDADLIQKGGVVNQQEGNLVTLQNGCICCSLQMDLINQLNDLHRQNFDYIVLEASGLSVPASIAQSICSIPQMQKAGDSYPYIDCIVTMVDSLRMQKPLEEDLQGLIVEQIEFCNIVLLNKTDMVSGEQLAETKAYIRALQPVADIIECQYGNVDLDSLLHTDRFQFDKVASSATWVQELEHHDAHHHHDDDDDDDCDCHCDHNHDDDDEHEHHHHHHHHDEKPYGIESFVYYRRPPFDMNKFDFFVNNLWPKGILRAKGLCWFEDHPDLSCIFEQAGDQKQLTEGGCWYAAAPPQEWLEIIARDPQARDDWDENYGDRMQKIVFIGKNLDKHALIDTLDSCLVTE